MNYAGERTPINQKFKPYNNTQTSLRKSNTTLWKSNYNTSNTGSTPFEEKKIENEYIDNLKKQIYFMEMELKLMKEREKEIEKSGGITQIFNDERDPSQHILQLKQKYSNMRKRMEDIIDQLKNKKRESTALNVSLKSKLENISSLTKEVYIKASTNEEKFNHKLITLENDYTNRQKERLEIEATNRLQELELKNEIANSIDLEYYIQSAEKLDRLLLEEAEKRTNYIQNLTRERIKQYESVNFKIKELESKTNEEPYFKIESEKNNENKKKIDYLEKEILELNTKIEMLEMSNDYLVKKKESVINERKKLINTNDEIKKEIETKQQLHEIRVQKKVKEKNVEEIQKLEIHLQEVTKNVTDLETKIVTEVDKVKNLSNEIIRANLELKIAQEKRNYLGENVDFKFKELVDLKTRLEKFKEIHVEIKEKISKEETENQLLRNRNKVLSEEYSVVNSKYNFILNNSDYTSNLKKISMDDLRTLTQTNTLVNESITNLVSKVAAFKKQNVQSLLDIE